MERIYLSLLSTVTTVLLFGSIANAGDQVRRDLSISEGTASPRVGLRSGLIAEQADAGPRAGAVLALRIGQEREKAHPGSEALQSRGGL